METDSKPAILVVDDEPSTRFLLRDWLEESDYTLIEPGDGVAALERLGAASELIDTLILGPRIPLNPHPGSRGSRPVPNQEPIAMETDSKPAILVVDDDPSTRYLLRDWLEESGYAVIEAEDGVAALETLVAASELIDTLILDHRMPRKDGLTVLREMRADPRFSSLPVIMQTTLDDLDHVAACLQAGARYYLVKPADSRILLLVVMTAVNESRHQRAARQSAALGLTALGMLQGAEFRFRTLTQAHALAAYLAQAFPEPGRTSLGLLELFINAVEHGNLEIDFDDKTRLLESGGWDAEIERRLDSAPYRERSVLVRFECREDGLQVELSDEGQGFDWGQHLEINPDHILLPHGRGIAMAKAMSFDALTYHGKGNQVVARVQTSVPPLQTP